MYSGVGPFPKIYDDAERPGTSQDIGISHVLDLPRRKSGSSRQRCSDKQKSAVHIMKNSNGNSSSKNSKNSNNKILTISMPKICERLRTLNPKPIGTLHPQLDHASIVTCLAAMTTWQQTGSGVGHEGSKENAKTYEKTAPEKELCRKPGAQTMSKLQLKIGREHNNIGRCL